MDVSSFLGGSLMTHADLQQPYQLLTITKVDQRLVGQGPKAEQKICVTFSELPQKALGLNKTNLKRIAARCTTDSNRWIGQQLLVYRSVTDYQGERKLCVRVCGPQQAPTDPICDQQGNAVFFQPQPQAAPPAVVQPVPPATVVMQPTAPPAPQPIAAPPAVTQSIAPAPQQPVAPPAPQQPEATPWEQQDNSPPAG